MSGSGEVGKAASSMLRFTFSYEVMMQHLTSDMHESDHDDVRREND